METTWIDTAIGKALRCIDAIAADVTDFPHVTEPAGWTCTRDGVWTGGFWAGLLWLAEEQLRSGATRDRAIAWTDRLLPCARATHNHDLGFMFFPSAIKGWQLTGETRYHQAALDAAAALAAQANERTGYIPGWGFFGGADWSGSVLVDTLMNLPLLVWASRQGGDARLMDVVQAQTAITLAHHRRPDGSFHHVYKFDAATGAPIGPDTYQGYGPESTWSRGQAWAITGFAILAGMTGNPAWRDASRDAAARFAARLPDTTIPPWDFDAPGANEPRDSAAAAIAAYGFLKLHQITGDTAHRAAAERLLHALAATCANDGAFGGVLLHATADLPHGLGINGSTMYGDFYYLKALVALKTLAAG